MKIRDKISAVVGFRTLPTTILLVLVYAAIFTAVLVTDELPAVPKDRGGLDLDQANVDLHQIATRPHPYNSHSNDLVHSFLLTRLKQIASLHPHVHVIEDLISNGSWVVPSSSAGEAVYFEGTNILVKIDGSDPQYRDEGGVLFSAHYDSVSTAPGVTDDGMGVATLLQLVSCLAERSQKEGIKRTAVFNFNNGEEDGLMGAHTFLEHPWSNITDTFLNLEGAAAGGRPMLFRATSRTPLLSFRSAHVPHPHANVLSADGFARGLIRSSTDYTVYSYNSHSDDSGRTRGRKRGMEGLDFAFYRGRSKYHTKYDSVPGTVGGQRALWAMMEAVRGAGNALVDFDAHQEGVDGIARDGAVYFDLFAKTLVIFPLGVLLTVNIILLATGPVVLLGFVCAAFFSGRCRLLVSVGREESGHDDQNETGSGEVETENLTLAQWISAVRQWQWREWWTKNSSSLCRIGKFWVAIILGGVGAQCLLVLGYVKLNPFIVYSHPYLVLVSTLSLAYISIVLLLNINFHSTHSAGEQKQTAFLQTYILTYILLLLSTVVLGKLGVGGFYFVTMWNGLVLVAVVMGRFENGLGARAEKRIGEEAEADERGGEIYDVAEGGTMADLPQANAPEEAEAEAEAATERTPLIARQLHHPSTDEEGKNGWWLWIIQLLLVVPIPVILVSHIGIFAMGAMSQTLADGSSPVTVYGIASLVSFLTILPLAPFSSKIHRHLTTVVLLVFVVSTMYTWLAFPFSQDAPLKVFFQQKLELDLGARSNGAGNGTAGVVRAVTTLTGVPAYIDTHIVPRFPSAWGKQRHCMPQPRKPGLVTCTWESGLFPAPGATFAKDKGYSNIIRTPDTRSTKNWLLVNTTRLSSNSARISLKGTNTRACRVYFDDARITGYRVHGSSGILQNGYEIPAGGVHELTLWSRTWGRTFVVDVDWAKKAEANSDVGSASGNDTVKGRVACEWVEYESATAGGEGSGGKIPALEEVLAFLPKWAVVSKMTDGLVEAWGPFSIL